MAADFVSIAYDNFINKERVLLVTAVDSSPIRRLISESKENGMLIDCSQGRKTRSVIFLDSDHGETAGAATGASNFAGAYSLILLVLSYIRKRFN